MIYYGYVNKPKEENAYSTEKEKLSIGERIMAGVGVVGGSIVFAWLVGNNITGVGAVDDAATIPTGAYILEQLGRLVSGYQTCMAH